MLNPHNISLSDQHFHQTYETEFKIKHIRYICKDKFIDRVSDSTLREALCVADVAFNMFFNDVKVMVKAGVLANIASGADEDTPGLQLRLNERKRNLKNWLSLNSGLLDYGVDNYAHLLRIIVTDPALVVRGLPGTTDSEMSTTAFAQSLFDMVINPTRNPAGAPILPKGAFWPALQVAVDHLIAMAPADPPKFIVNVLRITTEYLKIHFVPWRKDHIGPGRQSRTPVWNSWATLGISDPNRDMNSLSLRPEEVIHKAALDAQHIAMGRDANVSWNLKDVKLRNLATAIDHDALPSDWTIPAQSTSYVLDTYKYVCDIYDNKKELHKLALLVSIILGRCLPNIHTPSDTHRLLADKATKAETRHFVRTLPWVSKSKTKGSKESNIHITMFTTFIIVLYDSGSPLRKYMAEHDDSLGNLWTDKHSMSSFFLLHIFLSFFFCQDPRV